MGDENKTKKQLIDELAEMRQRISELEAMELECKQAEEELAKERNFLNIVLDNLPLDVYVKDTEGRFILANASTMRQLRVTTPEEYIGKTDFDFMPQSQEMPMEYFADEQKIIQTGEPLLNNEQTGIDPDGVQRWSLTSKLPLHDAEGNITGIVGIGLDIDERKQVAEKLRTSEERLRGLSEASFEAIFISEKGICLEQNQAAEKMFGYTLDEAIGRYGTEWIVPEDRETVTHNMLSGYEEPYEVTALCKDGATFPAEIRGKMMHYKGRSVRVTSLRDITKRKQAAEEVHRLSQFLESVIDNANIWLNVLDENANVMIWNKAAETISGYSREEVVGNGKIWEWLYPDEMYRKEIITELAEVVKRGQVVEGIETTIRCKDGQQKIIAWNERGLLNDKGNPTGSIAIGLDVTERKQAEYALRESEASHRLLVENAPVGIMFVDTEGHILSVNHIALKLVGSPSEEATRKINVLTFPLLVEVGFSADFRRCLETETTVVAECLYTSKWGKEAYLRYYLTPMRDANNKIMGLQSIFEDITVHKQAEHERLEFIRERERIEVLKRFVSDVSHDLRTPLSSINASLYVLKMVADPKVKLPQQLRLEKQQEHLAILETQATHLQKLIEDMYTMSRLDTMVELDLGIINLNTLVGNVLTEHSNLQASKQQNVEFTTDADLPTFEGNEEYLSLAVGNVVLNALHYTSDEEAVTIRAYVQEKQVVIEVQDNGMGIDDEDLPHIFERFYRGDEARSTNTGGTGLGLAIAQKIVELHRGEIEVESEKDKGTTFKVMLPVQENV